MKIRTKLILLLLALALIPLVVAAAVRWTNAQKVAGLVGDQTAAIARSRTADLLAAYGANVRANSDEVRRRIELLVSARAARVERSLDERFTEGLPDLGDEESERGRELDAGLPRLQRLRSLAPRLPIGAEAAPIDPGAAAWYRSARESGRTVWLPPERADGLARVTVSRPVYHSDGAFAGAVGASVPLADVVPALRLPSRLTTGTELILLVEGSGEVPLRAASRPPTAGGWLEPQRLEPLAIEAAIQGMRPLDQEAVFDEVLDLGEGETAIGSLFVQAPVAPGVALLARVPRESVVVDSERVEEELKRLATEQVRIEIGVSFLVAILIAGLGWLGGKTLTKPLRRLVEAVEKVAEGNLDVAATVKRRDEIGRLARAFNEMVPQVKGQMDDSSGRRAASRLQEMLNDSMPTTLPGLEFASRSVTSERVGGDFQEFFDEFGPASGDHAIVIGDVAGDGLAAAMLASETRTLLRTHAGSPGDLCDLAERMNSDLLKLLEDGRFVSLFVACLPRLNDSGIAPLSYLNAGHDPALLYDPETDAFRTLASGGMPFGIDEQAQFEHDQDELRTGGVLFIGTDGVGETRDHHGKTFGNQRLQDTIRQYAAEPADVIADAILTALDQFSQGAPRLDDQTFVVVKLG
ncbi:MAG: SpoIIE family protein phosphatase [Planctomycetota bacterium]